MASMRATLQPIVAVGQQLIIGESFSTVQLMVATRAEAKKEFSRRLNEALDGIAECPKDRGRPAWLARRYKVSGEGARKWLEGESIPDQTNIIRISQDLGINPNWLQAGIGDKNPMEHATDSTILALSKTLKNADESVKMEILSFAKWRVAQDGPNPPPRSTEPRYPFKPT